MSDAIATASAVLSALAAGSTQSQVSRELGISRQRVSAIAKAAGIGAGKRRPDGTVTVHTARGRELLGLLVRDAAAADVTPEQYLANARREHADRHG
jgi:transcriptional regulator